MLRDSARACWFDARWSNTIFLEVGLSRVLVAASSKPSNRKVLSTITTSTFCLFMCSWRLMKIDLRCQNPAAFTSALWGPQLLRTYGGENHSSAIAAYSAMSCSQEPSTRSESEGASARHPWPYVQGAQLGGEGQRAGLAAVGALRSRRSSRRAQTYTSPRQRPLP